MTFAHAVLVRNISSAMAVWHNRGTVLALIKSQRKLAFLLLLFYLFFALSFYRNINLAAVLYFFVQDTDLLKASALSPLSSHFVRDILFMLM